MKRLDLLLADKLLNINAVKFQPDAPFVWAMGWNSPIYLDNLAVLSYPDVRNFIKIELSRMILEQFGDVDMIAAVATGAIAQGVQIADNLGLPFAYVRNTPKDFGLENLIEGNIIPGQKVVIVEDMVYTGTNSARAATAIREAGGKVVGMVAIFNYRFPISDKTLKKANIKHLALSNYDALIKSALAKGFISEDDMLTLEQWRVDPENWVPTEVDDMID